MPATPSPEHTDAYLVLAGVVLTFLGTEWRFRRQSKAEHARLRLQLHEERDRLDRQLAEERGRLGQQLAHERQLVDLGEQRALLDLATTRGADIVDKLADAWVAAGNWADASNPVDAEEAKQRTYEARSAAYRLLWPMEELLGRLAIRIGRDHAATGALAEFRTAAQSAIRGIPEEKLTSDAAVRESISPQSKMLQARRTAFADEALRLVGSRLAEPDPAHAVLRRE